MRRNPPRSRHNRNEGRRPRAQQPVPALKRPGSPPGTDWDHVAEWYDKLIGDDGSDYHRRVILPAALRLLGARAGQRILDICCGQGVLARCLAESVPQIAEIVGVDASPQLIDAARRRTPTNGGPRMRFEVHDARQLESLSQADFDAAACLMAVHDVDDIAALFGGAAHALRSGGRLVIVMMHPCFRIPRQSSWGWDADKKTQYRRLDRYAEPLRIPVATHPGRAADEHTQFFHRSLTDYFAALEQAGFVALRLEELYSHRRAEPGGRSRGENRAAEEFPLFLALCAEKAARQ